MKCQRSPLLYIVVVGFHHKKGCRVEFVHPVDERIQKLPTTTTSTTPEQSTNTGVDLYKLPAKWRHLASLALPDGSHNYDSDHVYFHLEDDTATSTSTSTSSPVSGAEATHSRPNRTIFGIACYRQLDASQLLAKDTEVTRNTLQKSVCVLSDRPLYGNGVRAHLAALTAAYFEQRGSPLVFLLFLFE